jgi:hypothetical protein
VIRFRRLTVSGHEIPIEIIHNRRMGVYTVRHAKGGSNEGRGVTQEEAIAAFRAANSPEELIRMSRPRGAVARSKQAAD